jgi:hypothetical protein
VGETITLTVTFDGPVNGLNSGTNSTIFTVGGTGVNATWGGAAGTNTRTLTYTVQAGQNGQAGIDEGALKAALTAGISDTAGNAFAYTLNSGNIPNIDSTALPVIDTTLPASTVFSITSITDNVGATTAVPNGGHSNDSTPTLSGTFGASTAAATLASGEFMAIYRAPDMTGAVNLSPNSNGSSPQIPNGFNKIVFTIADGNFVGNNGGPIYLPTAPTIGQVVQVFSDAYWTVTIHHGNTPLYRTKTGESVFYQWDGSNWVNPLVYVGKAVVNPAAAGGQSTWSFTDETVVTGANQYVGYIARLEDAAGNTHRTSSVYGFTLDTVAPVVPTCRWGHRC